MIGPIVEDFIWQAKAGKGFATSDFRIDWGNARAVCPQGKLSRGWQVARADYVMEIIHNQFLKQESSVCPTEVIARRPIVSVAPLPSTPGLIAMAPQTA